MDFPNFGSISSYLCDVKAELEKRFGAHRVMDVPREEGQFPLLMLDLELDSPVSVLMTNGLSDYEMPVPEKWKGREFNELFFCLPSYWEWEDMSNPRTNWVFDKINFGHAIFMIFVSIVFIRNYRLILYREFSAC